MKLRIKRGDIFLSKNPMSLGKLINAVQRFWSTDDKSKYSHAGIILTETGHTLEALWTVKSQNLYVDYKDTDILIARYVGVKDVTAGLHYIRKHRGQWYPFYRLLFMAIPPIGKYINFGRVVCSELVCKYLAGADLDITWKGKSPDNIHDIVKNGKDWIIIHEGKI